MKNAILTLSLASLVATALSAGTLDYTTTNSTLSRGLVASCVRNLPNKVTR